MNGYELKTRLDLDIDPIILDQLLMHSSYLNENKNDPNYEEIKKRNEYYSEVGRSILDLLNFLYLYNKDDIITTQDLSENLRLLKMPVSEAFYNKYKLEGIIYLSKGENQNISKKYLEIVNRIFYAIYQQVSFSRLYDIFLETVLNIQLEDTADYKSMLLEYSNRIGQIVTFDLVSETGRDDNKEFVVEVKFNGKRFLGKGRSKKKASKESAKQCCLFYNVTRDRKTNSKSSPLKNNMKWEVGKDRKDQLSIIYKKFNIKEKELPWHYLDACFTHKSIEIEHKNVKHYDNNSFLSMLGSFVFSVASEEYLIDKFCNAKETVGIASLRGIIVEKENLERFIPKSWEDMFIASKGLKTTDSNTSIVRIEAFKAILGSMFLNAFYSKEKNPFSGVQRITNAICNKTFEKSEPNYSSILQEIIATLGFTLDVKKIEFKGKVHDPNYYCEIKLSDENGRISTVYKIGEGKSIVKARSNASYEMIKYIEMILNGSNSNSNSRIDYFLFISDSLDKIRKDLRKILEPEEKIDDDNESYNAIEPDKIEKVNNIPSDNLDGFKDIIIIEKQSNGDSKQVISSQLNEIKKPQRTDSLPKEYMANSNLKIPNNNGVSQKILQDKDKTGILKINDIGKENPEKQLRTILATKRNITLVKRLKKLYNYECQVCGLQIQILNDQYICEVHHIQPLGQHGGADKSENMIVLCPNHHAMFDNGIISIDLEDKSIIHADPLNKLKGHKVNIKHKIDFKYVEYHNKNILIEIEKSHNSNNVVKPESNLDLCNIISYGDEVKLKDSSTGEVFEIKLENISNKIFMTSIQRTVLNLSLGDKFVFENYNYEVVEILKGL